MTTMNAVAGAILVVFCLFLVGLTVVVFTKPAVAERFFYVIREFGASTLHRASYPPSNRRVSHRSLWGHVATEGLLFCRVGHRLILVGVDPYSLAMAPSFRRGGSSDAHSAHETVCGRAIGVRSFTYLRGVYCGFPKCCLTTRTDTTVPNHLIHANSVRVWPLDTRT